PARLIGQRLLRFGRQVDAVRREIDDVTHVDGEIARRAWGGRAHAPSDFALGLGRLGARGKREGDQDGPKQAHPASAPPRKLQSPPPSTVLQLSHGFSHGPPAQLRSSYPKLRSKM